MKRKPLFIASGIIAIAAAIAAAGCGGGTQTSGVAPVTAAAATTAQATLSIVIPPKSSTSSSSRGTEYVSPSTTSVSFQLPSMTTATVVAVGPGVSGCTGSTVAGYVCTASFTAPLGANQSLTVKALNTSGAVLSQNVVPITVAATGGNAVTVTLNGVVASIALSSSAGNTVTVGTPGTTTITWTALDASGNTIIAPGTLVDASGAALATPSPSISPSADSSAFSIGSYSGTATGGSWVGTYNGTAATSPLVITASVTNSGVTAGTLSITVNAAPTASPSASPTATASASPSPSPTATAVANALTNGNFESGDFTGWYKCYAGHTALTASVDPNPAPSLNPEPTQSPPGTTIGQTIQNATLDATIATSVPSGTIHGGTYAALVGQDSSPFALPSSDGRDKGLVGICQDVAVPASSPSLTLWVYEGGNTTNISGFDAEADVITAAETPGWVAGTGTGAGSMHTTDPFKTTNPLFADANCYNNLNTSGGALTAAPCATGSPASAQPPNVPGGQWVQKGPYDLSAYAGQTVTLMLGVWSSSTSTGYYDYALYDDVVLTHS